MTDMVYLDPKFASEVKAADEFLKKLPPAVREQMIENARKAKEAEQQKKKILGLPAPVVFILGAGVVVLGVMYVINRK